MRLNEGMRLRSRVLLRTRWRAVLGVGVIAGLLGGGLVALATAARETDGSVARYMAGLDSMDHLAIFCPPGARASDPESECFTYEPADEVDRLRADERVEGAGRFAAAPVYLRAGQGWTPMFAYVALDDLDLFGQPPVIDGAPADLDDPGQVMVNESLARRHGVAVGDRVEVAPQSWQELQTGTEFTTPEMSATTAVATGILRTPDDLHANDSSALQLNESTLFLGRGWVEAVGEAEFARYGVGVGLVLQPGSDPRAVLDTARPARTPASRRSGTSPPSRRPSGTTPGPRSPPPPSQGSPLSSSSSS